MAPEPVRHVSDDAIGRALDHLFDADRGSLLTDVVVAATSAFGLKFDELHNDSTTVRFCGQYRQAWGRSIRGKKGPFITYGNSKDHRPDLKQLLLVLTTTRDGAVPVQFRCEAGNHSDSVTHEKTWDALRRATGRTDFLYVADSKLCSREAMDHIDRLHGRFVCVLPRSRLEDGEFRKRTETPADRPASRCFGSSASPSATSCSTRAPPSASSARTLHPSKARCSRCCACPKGSSTHQPDPPGNRRDIVAEMSGK